MAKIPLMIDTDTAGDDCLALLIGLLDPAANLLGITVTAGNLPFDRQLTNALLTVNAAGKLGKVPVHAGQTEPLTRAWISAEEVHGDGVGGLSADLTDFAADEVHAVDALIQASVVHEGELVIVCIAPLTTIAAAIQRDPGFATRVKHFYVMGGSNNARGNVTAAAEYNFYVDPEAAEVLLRSGARVTIVPWAPLTLDDAVFDRKQRAVLAKLDTGLAQFFGRVISDTLVFEEAVGIAGSTHPDSLTTAIALHPRLATKKSEYNVQVETTSELTRGYAAMSWGIHGLDPNAVVVERADAEHFFRFVERILKSPARPTVPFVDTRAGTGATDASALVSASATAPEAPAGAARSAAAKPAPKSGAKTPVVRTIVKVPLIKKAKPAPTTPASARAAKAAEVKARAAEEARAAAEAKEQATAKRAASAAKAAATRAANKKAALDKEAAAKAAAVKRAETAAAKRAAAAAKRAADR